MHSGIVAYWHTDSERISCITGDEVHFIINIRWNQIIGYDTRISIWSLLVPAWWRHQMETFSALLALCVGNSPITGEFPAQRPVTRSFDVFFDLRLNKRLSKQSWGWRFETPSRPLWRHCNGRSKDQQWPSHTWSKDQASGAGTTSAWSQGQQCPGHRWPVCIWSSSLYNRPLRSAGSTEGRHSV